MFSTKHNLLYEIERHQGSSKADITKEVDQTRRLNFNWKERKILKLCSSARTESYKKFSLMTPTSSQLF